MSEWIRHRGSKSMPKRLNGKLFEAVDRDGCKWPARDVQDARDWQHTGSGDDIMKYRILGDINPPDYSKGFPVGTTAKDIGAKVGDEFVSLVSNRIVNKGDAIKLAEDDGTTLPYFSKDGVMSHGDFVCMKFSELSPITPKTAIELQAEEVGIPEPVQLVDDAKPDADGWIEWKGGECPVPDGTLVDVKFRDGHMASATPANEMDDRYPADASGAFWIADGSHNDIVAYRLHQPQEKQKAGIGFQVEVGSTTGPFPLVNNAKLSDDDAWFDRAIDNLNRPKNAAQEWPEDRMDVIGQNGNDGLHYDAAGRPIHQAQEQQKNFLSINKEKADISTSKHCADIFAGAAQKQVSDAIDKIQSSNGKSIADLPTNKYQRTIKGVTVDVYDVLAAFGVTCQARGHAIKKLLMAGQRGHKDEAQDLREAVQAIERSIQLNEGK